MKIIAILLLLSVAFLFSISSPWQRLSAMQMTRTEMASVAVNGEILILGGYLHPISLSSVEKYSPIKDAWVSLKDMPTSLDHSAAVSLGTDVYVIGGLERAETGITSNEVFKFSLTQNKWERVSSLPESLGAVSAVVIGHTIHVFGGLNTNGPSASHYLYNIDRDEWSKAENMPTPNHHMAIATDGVRIFLTGGSEKFPDSLLSRVLVFDTKTKKWQEGPKLPTPRGDAQGTIIGKYFIVAGGENANGEVFDVIEALDMDLMTWKTLPSLRLARHGHASVSIGNSLYIIGGRDKNHNWGYTDLNERLEIKN
ncbi:kelch repeat-containing protein [Methylomonas sp. AM2-LC]|uniref:Kelch repeat-containing protein n=1 Tax=Methylomonas sp. AM2-LC TaxID=3153301 RepID=UPI0032635583